MVFTSSAPERMALALSTSPHIPWSVLRTTKGLAPAILLPSTLLIRKNAGPSVASETLGSNLAPPRRPPCWPPSLRGRPPCWPPSLRGPWGRSGWRAPCEGSGSRGRAPWGEGSGFLGGGPPSDGISPKAPCSPSATCPLGRPLKRGPAPGAGHSPFGRGAAPDKSAPRTAAEAILLPLRSPTQRDPGPPPRAVGYGPWAISKYSLFCEGLIPGGLSGEVGGDAAVAITSWLCQRRKFPLKVS